MRVIFGLRGLSYAFGALTGMNLSEELETNERATMKSKEVLKFQKEYKEKMIKQGKNPEQFEGDFKLPYFSFLWTKLKMAKQGLMQPVFRNFTLFLIFIGITMPSFSSYDFYFHVD